MDKLTISKIKELLSGDCTPQFLNALQNDSRKGVQDLVSAYYRRKKHQETLMRRWREMCAYEKEVWSAGGLVIGVDEAGRGPLAGPVVAAAVVLPPDCYLPGLADSKTLSPRQRSALLEKITEVALDWSVGIVGPAQIDELNIFHATQLAMKQAVEGLEVSFTHLFVDGNMPCRLLDFPQRPIVKGDALSVSIAAASIIAKETRDRLMVDLDALYPGYGFAKHKGYPTPDHLASLKQLGPSPVHRRSFAPVSALCGKEQKEFGSQRTGKGR
ncbi:MAG: ribonuclease HII [Firmicutes bacterium]|nr:ribonuclease HII [Bacillota bacterium]